MTMSQICYIHVSTGWRARKCLFLLMMSCILLLLYKLSLHYNFQKDISFPTAYFNRANADYTRLIQNNTLNQDIEAMNLHNVPKVIYMLWDKGWTEAPRLQRYCLESFRRHNAEFTIKAMNLTEAESLIDRKTHYTDQAWESASIQAKSDIIRVELVTRYGGIWADASVYCNKPVLNWLNDTLMSSKFFAFERTDDKVTQEIAPWIASWFLVATTNSEMARTWRDRIRQAWSEKQLPPKLLGYFWVHRIFRNLVLSNSTFGAWFDEMPFISADPSHCLGQIEGLPPVYKLKAGPCRKPREKVFARGY